MPLFSLPEWASNPADLNQVKEPSAGLKKEGWSKNSIPPRNITNWLHQQAYFMLKNLQAGALVYASPELFADPTAGADAGDVGIVTGLDPSSSPMAEVAALDPHAGAALISVDGDARRIVCAWNTATPSVDVRFRSGGLDATLTLTNVPTAILRAVTNGSKICVAYDNYVETFNATSPYASVGVYNHGAGVADIALDHTQVYLVGAAGTGGNHARAVTLADGTTATWSFIHGASLNAVCTDGVRCYVGGNLGTTNMYVRAIHRTSGAEIWADGTVVVSAGQTMATDGEQLMVKGGTQLITYQTWIDNPLTTQAVGGTTGAIAMSPRYFMMRFGNLVAYQDRKLQNPPLDATATITNLAAAIDHGAAPATVYCDGGYVYTGGALSSSATLRIHQLPQLRDRQWRRVDPDADAFMPLRQLAFPLE